MAKTNWATKVNFLSGHAVNNRYHYRVHSTKCSWIQDTRETSRRTYLNKHRKWSNNIQEQTARRNSIKHSAHSTNPSGNMCQWCQLPSNTLGKIPAARCRLCWYEYHRLISRRSSWVNSPGPSCPTRAMWSLDPICLCWHRGPHRIGIFCLPVQEQKLKRGKWSQCTAKTLSETKKTPWKTIQFKRNDNRYFKGSTLSPCPIFTDIPVLAKRPVAILPRSHRNHRNL